MAKLKSLNFKLNSVKTELTILRDFVDNFDSTKFDIEELCTRFEHVQPLLNEFKAIHAEIATNQSETDLEQSNNELKSFMNDYFQTKSLFKKQIALLQNDQTTNNHNANNNHNSTEIIWLRVRITSSDSKVIAGYYVDALKFVVH
ncbi:hypothetical protein RN001_000718 [Aquatica leii]|uniref:Uncharacterized protein n=1 Tax=Aquatica leii TaxID=1421715 RepID=A0AAN7SJ99_9COLE|nr:hypothetical protein RN001_000718 [Aquatica leii]